MAEWADIRFTVATGVGMEYGGGLRDRVGLPEDRDEEFDERALERAIRDNRRRELEALAQLNN